MKTNNHSKNSGLKSGKNNSYWTIPTSAGQNSLNENAKAEEVIESTHQKFMMMWNNDETSWDSPSHTNRSTYEGRVLNGSVDFDLHSYNRNVVLIER